MTNEICEKVKMQSFTLKLKSIRRHIEYPNAGGCAIVMIAMYRYLKKNKMLKGNEAFVYLYSSETDPGFVSNKSALERNEGSPTSCSHAVLAYDNKYWDCDGEYDSPYSVKLEIPVEYEQFIIESLNKDKSVWNYMFDREEGIPSLERIFEVELNDIKRR